MATCKVANGLPTVIEPSTSGAALNWALPGCLAESTTLPGEENANTLPAKVAFPDFTLTSTGRPEFVTGGVIVRLVP